MKNALAMKFVELILTIAKYIGAILYMYVG